MGVQRRRLLHARRNDPRRLRYRCHLEAARRHGGIPRRVADQIGYQTLFRLHQFSDRIDRDRRRRQGRAEGRGDQLAQGDLEKSRLGNHRRRIPRVLPAHQPRGGQSVEDHSLQRRGRDRVQGPAVCPEPGSARFVRARRTEGHSPLCAQCVHHRRLQGPAARVPAVPARRGGFE